jgi:hypothetical protein
MTTPERNCEPNSPRVLLFSERNLCEQVVWRCSFTEFENILEEIESVDVVAPGPRPWYRQGKRLALRAGEKFSYPINPGVQPVTVNKDYDLFFTVVEKPSELLHLKAVEGWKERCRTSFCWVTEFYTFEIPLLKSALEVLSQFDHVLFMYNTSEPFRKIIRGQGHYLPAGIDAIEFCPYPNPPQRCIDVLSIGRRSEETHHALLQLARDEGLFYVYDTFSGLHAYNLREHRQLFANMAKRTRYFLANPGKINLPEETGGQSEFGYRHFEGAAPGTIMIGERPRNNKEFDRIFHWEDAVIDLPFGSDQIGEVIRDLDRQPERQARIRKTNIMQSLLHHDWVYRWEDVLRLAGLSPLPALLERKARLAGLAELVEHSAQYPQESAPQVELCR